MARSSWILLLFSSTLFTALMTEAKINESSEDEVTLTVYYESLCPDSKRFIVDQVYPAWELFGPKLNVQLKPFGKASWVDSREGAIFTCQHGPHECFGNMIQACLLKEVAPAWHVPLVECLMATPDPPGATEECAEELGISIDSLEECLSNNEGERLMKEIGTETKNLNPALHYVPWITFNGHYNEKDWKASLENLQGVLCENYLENVRECHHTKHTIKHFAF